MKTKYIWWIGSTTMLVIIAGVVVKPWGTDQKNEQSNSTSSSEQQSSEATKTDEAYDEMILVVEAGDGILKASENSGSYISESARGLEAYLASDGDSASYVVNIEEAGSYVLDVKLSDDGTWRNGDRSATVSVNGSLALQYDHISENTNGWKWYTLGQVNLKAGENNIVFTKGKGGYAAFVMDEFRLKPTVVEHRE